MKSDEIDIVASYLIWIPYEGVKRKFDFSGQRDLHKFVEQSKEANLHFLGIEPWEYSEVRNGGFPDWVGFHLKLQHNTEQMVSLTTYL